MGITVLPGAPFFTGTTASSTDIPSRWPVGINGRGFLIDEKSQSYRRQSIPLLRQQADQSSEPGEASINPDDLWRRVTASWHSGAGQTNLDATESVRSRFYTSKGIDPWEHGELRLLPDVDAKRSSANTNLAMAVAGTYLYLIDGSSIVYTQDISVDTPTWTDITGESATAAVGITSDGYHVWTANGSDGIYETTRGAATTAKGVTGTVAGVRYVKGRLFAWSGASMYNVVDVDTGTPAALPTALLEHANTDFAWVDVTEGPGFYYMAGFSGDKSTIYQSAVKTDGTGLEVPMVAAELPDGEIVRSLGGYLGYVLIGTDKGIRFAAPNDSGELVLGGLIEDVPEARCFEGQGRYVWFGWSQYDATSTGLGRLDLSVFNGVRPAYASDLMVTDDGDVTSVVTFGDLRVLAVSGSGIWAQDTDLVASGQLESGRIAYGIFDPKISMYVTVNHEPLAGTVAMEMARNSGDYATLNGENSVAGTTQTDFTTNRARAEHFNLRLTLTRSGSDATDGPVVGRLTLRAYPAAKRSERISVPLLIGHSQVDRLGNLHLRDVIDDLAFLASLEDGTAVSYQEGPQTFAVVVEDHDWRPHHLEDDGSAFSGTYLIFLKRFAEA